MDCAVAIEWHKAAARARPPAMVTRQRLRERQAGLALPKAQRLGIATSRQADTCEQACLARQYRPPLGPPSFPRGEGETAFDQSRRPLHGFDVKTSKRPAGRDNACRMRALGVAIHRAGTFVENDAQAAAERGFSAPGCVERGAWPASCSTLLVSQAGRRATRTGRPSPASERPVRDTPQRSRPSLPPFRCRWLSLPAAAMLRPSPRPTLRRAGRIRPPPSAPHGCRSRTRRADLPQAGLGRRPVRCRPR